MSKFDSNLVKSIFFTDIVAYTTILSKFLLKTSFCRNTYKGQSGSIHLSIEICGEKLLKTYMHFSKKTMATNFGSWRRKFKLNVLTLIGKINLFIVWIFVIHICGSQILDQKAETVESTLVVSRFSDIDRFQIDICHDK